MRINLMCNINQTGYGQVGLHWLVELNKLGHKIAFFPISGPNSIQCSPEYHDVIKESLQNAQMWDLWAPCVKVWHQFDLALRVSKPYISAPIFELDTFSELEKHHLSSSDRIIVNSAWAKDVIINQLNRAAAWECRTSVVPLGVDRQVFADNQTRQFRKTTVFLTAGKFEIRKGHDFLINCFNSAFSPSDDVELQFLSNTIINEPHKKMADFIVDLAKTSSLASKIKFLPHLDTHYDVARVMNSVDCGIFPSRGEGWNLEALEMMSCGKPIIVTNYSAHTEFCTDKNSMLINVDEVEPAYDGVFFHRQGNWAKFNDNTIDQIVQYMRQIHKAKQAGDNLINNFGIQTAEKYTWKNSARKLMEILGGN